MRLRLKLAMISAGLILATQATSQVTFYQGEEFRGPSFRVDTTIENFDPLGFNDRASSAVVEQGRWEVCEDAGFRGRCTILSPGNYPSLAPMGFNKRISSARPIAVAIAISGRDATAARAGVRLPPAPGRASVRGSGAFRARSGRSAGAALLGRAPAGRRALAACANVPGAVVGAIIGGVLGHQVGGGRGQDVATAGGAVAGAAIGANVGRSPGGVYSQDVQRCTVVPGSARPDYWDVMYYFDGLEHHTQLSAPPPPTIWVSRNGEPRM